MSDRWKDGLAVLAAMVVAALYIFGYAALKANAAEPIHTGRAGIELIEHFEGYYPTVYRDVVGVATQCFGATGVELLELPPVATRAQCRAQLVRALAKRYEPAVRALKLGSQNRFDSVTSAAYNLGTGVLDRGRSLGDALRSRQWRRAADTFGLYVYAGGRVYAGLVRRREAERRLFLTPDPIAFSAVERRLMKRRPAPKAALRAQARRVQLAARAVRDGWRLHDRARRYRALRARALTR